MPINNEQKVLFYEVQRFPAWLRLSITLSMVLAIALAGYALWSDFSSDKPISLSSIATAVIPGLLIPILVLVLFVSTKLETFVYSDCLCVRLFPFHLSYRNFTRDDLAEYYSCAYRPMLEYGGWGIRCGWHGKKVYNISGNRGVQLVFKNGKRLLIGSQKPDDFANALNLMS